MSETKKVPFYKNSDFKAITGTIIGAFLSAVSVVWILDLGSFYATGSAGMAQIITRICDRENHLPFLEGAIFAALNIPLIIIGKNGVSKKFALYSGISVILQTILFVLFRYIKWNPFLALKDDGTMLAIIGGLIGGVSSGITLRFGSSTGGIEIISQYYYVKKQGSFSGVTLIVNSAIIFAGYFVEGCDIKIVCYTLVRLIIYVIVVDKMHTIYKSVMIKIITVKGEEVRQALIERFNHGITIYNAVGGYSLREKQCLEIVVSSYEIEEYRKIVKQIDPKSFIMYSSINKIDGVFNHNIIA